MVELSKLIVYRTHSLGLVAKEVQPDVLEHAQLQFPTSDALKNPTSVELETPILSAEGTSNLVLSATRL